MQKINPAFLFESGVVINFRTSHYDSFFVFSSFDRLRLRGAKRPLLFVYLTLRRTPGEGSPHFDRFDGQNFTFPALSEGIRVFRPLRRSTKALPQDSASLFLISHLCPYG